MAFEVASVRPSNPAPPAGGRGGGPDGGACGGPGPAQIDPSRFAIGNISLYHLIVKAYATWAEPMGGCGGVIEANVLSGGPGWIRSDRWDIEAIISTGVPPYTWLQFAQGQAPELQEMLQQLLAERFALMLRRESREMPVYLLTVGRDGHRLIPSTGSGVRVRAGSQTLPGSIGSAVGGDRNGQFFLKVSAYKVSMAQLAAFLVSDGRPVLDRTGLAGEFDFDNVEYAIDEGFLRLLAGDRPMTAAPRPSLATALREQLGLELQNGRERIEVLVIESARKPSGN